MSSAVEDEYNKLNPVTTAGPTPQSTEKSIINPTENVGFMVGEIPILRMSDRKEIACKELWTKALGGHDGPVLFVLFRRFGCGLCQMLAMNFSALKPFFDVMNVKMVGVGVEEVGYDKFVERGYFQGGEIFVDKKHRTYNALKTSRYGIANFFGLMGDSEVGDLYNIAEKNGYKTNLKGDLSIYGGVFIIAPNGEKTLFSHLQDKTAMEPDMRKLMQSIGYTDKDMPRELYPSHTTDFTCLKKSVCETMDYVAKFSLLPNSLGWRLCVTRLWVTTDIK